MSDRQKAYKIYLLARLRGNGQIFCVQCERKTAYFESIPNAYVQTFSLRTVKSYYFLSFTLFLSKGASKAKIVSYL